MSPKSINIFTIFVLISLLIFISCSSPTESNGLFQTKRVYHTENQLISNSEMAIVQGLFQKNNLSLSNLQVYRLDLHDDYHYVRCYQFYNNLELFTNDVVFTFNNQDILSFIGGDLITSITVDTRPKVSEKDAGTLFYGEIKNDWRFKDSLSSYGGQCFTAELGFYNLNSGMSSAQNNFVLAWKMKIANGSEYPYGYIRADSLRLIYYTNGIILG